jgi:hypothetical protein
MGTIEPEIAEEMFTSAAREEGGRLGTMSKPRV